MTTSTRLSTRLSSLLMICILVTGQMLAQAGPQLPDPGNPPISREQQIQLGFQAASEVYKQMPVLPDNSPETQYIRQLGERLVATIPQQNSWPFEFHTIAQKDINAFALPGGPMFVNVGTINAASNEAQLAGVMAHEMAHVYMQHSAKQMQKNTGPSIVAGLGQILGSMIGGVGGALASIGGQMAGGMWSMKYSRADESQADAVGAMIMYRAGYNPRALADFFNKLAEEGGGSGGPQFLSDHPNPGNREQAIVKEVESWPPKQFRTNSAAFNQAKQHAQTLRLYTAQEIADGAKSGRWAELNRKNGAVFKAPPGVQVQSTGSPVPETSGPARPVSSREVMPSSRMVSENLGPLTIARPENWEIFAPQQQGQSLTIAPRAGLASGGVGYGVVINGAQSRSGNANLDQITSEIVQGLQSGGGDLQPVGEARSINVSGTRGRSVMMESTSPFPTSNGQQQREYDWLVTVPQRDGSVLYLVFVAPQAEFQRLKPTFDNMLRSLRF
jgi:beta-barrel assembly-enhancing protease